MRTMEKKKLEEAKELIKGQMSDDDFSWKTEAEKIAIECIKKQIPKKPRGYCKDYDEFGLCPVCGKCVADDFGCGYDYCPKCGQAILWE